MPITLVYPDLLALPERRVWPAFSRSCYNRHRAYFDGLTETYGEDVLGPGGLRRAVETTVQPLRQSIQILLAEGGEPELAVQTLLDHCLPLLPGIDPTVYLGTLFFLAPAATLSVGGRPAIAIGLERFTAGDPPPPPAGYPGRFFYRLSELEEMVPHEACHVARMEALHLPPTPRKLSLKEMLLLEGTALVFTDRLVGRQTLRTFMPDEVWERHQSQDGEMRRLAAADLDLTGMPAFARYFTPLAPVSGYYVGYSLCREYLERFGEGALQELVTLPSDIILRRLGV